MSLNRGLRTTTGTARVALGRLGLVFSLPVHPRPNSCKIGMNLPEGDGDDIIDRAFATTGFSLRAAPANLAA